MLDPVPTPHEIARASIRFRDGFDRANFVAWLGKLQNRRKCLRTLTPYKDIDISKSLIMRLINATYPWTITTYPGKVELLAMVIGVSPKCAASWLNKNKMSPQAQARAAHWLRAKIAEYQALAMELEQGLKENPPPVRTRGFRRSGPLKAKD